MGHLLRTCIRVCYTCATFCWIIWLCSTDCFHVVARLSDIIENSVLKDSKKKKPFQQIACLFVLGAVKSWSIKRPSWSINIECFYISRPSHYVVAKTGATLEKQKSINAVLFLKNTTRSTQLCTTVPSLFIMWVNILIYSKILPVLLPPAAVWFFFSLAYSTLLLLLYAAAAAAAAAAVLCIYCSLEPAVQKDCCFRALLQGQPCPALSVAIIDGGFCLFVGPR